jgi:hypothetical protein
LFTLLTVAENTRLSEAIAEDPKMKKCIPFFHVKLYIFYLATSGHSTFKGPAGQKDKFEN